MLWVSVAVAGALSWHGTPARCLVPAAGLAADSLLLPTAAGPAGDCLAIWHCSAVLEEIVRLGLF